MKILDITKNPILGHAYLNDFAFISFDVDWASEEMLKFVVDILKKYDLKATFFVTHDSSFLRSLDAEQFEIGLHPSYFDGGDIDEKISVLRDMYPDAIGERSHGLYFGSKYVNSWLKHGIKYESNISLPFQSYIIPHMHCSGLYRIPYIWDDSVHLSYGYDFNWDRLKWECSGLKIFSFHPVHIFYNTDSQDYYKYIKANDYPDRDFLDTPVKGSYDMFISLLEHIRHNGLKTGTLKDIYNKREDFID